MNAGRARSPGMTEALRVVHEEEIGTPGERRLRMRLEHIGTPENKVADLLSRGDIGEAIARVTARWGSCEVRTLDEVFLRSTERESGKPRSVSMTDGSSEEAGFGAKVKWRISPSERPPSR